YVFGSLIVTAGIVDAAGLDDSPDSAAMVAHVQQPAQLEQVAPEGNLPVEVQLDAQPLEYHNGHWNYLVSYQLMDLPRPGTVQFGNKTLAANVVNYGFMETGFTALAGQTYT